MNCECINATIIIDTAYGIIHKVATCRRPSFNNKQVLENFLDTTFNSLKIAILQEFENKENSNRIEVEDES